MYELEKIKQIKKIKEINYETINYSIKDLICNKEQLIKKIRINEKKLIDYNNNIVNEETNEYSIGDKIKYKIFNEEIGEIVRIYKTTGKVKVKNSNNKNIDIPKTLILSVIKQLDINDVKIKIADINNHLSILSKELTKTNNLIDEKEKQKELITSPTKLDDEIKLYNRKTEYVLFNILTNEYMNVKCEFQKLKKMIEYLIYSKYINSKSITDEDFIKIHKNIHKLYFA